MRHVLACLVLLHVGVKAEFEAEHIPGARFVAPSDLSILRAEGALILQLLPPDALRAVLESLGISDDSRVIVYFGKDWVSPSTRVTFSLDAAGLGDRTSILDGGDAGAMPRAGLRKAASAAWARSRVRVGTRTTSGHLHREGFDLGENAAQHGLVGLQVILKPRRFRVVDLLSQASQRVLEDSLHKFEFRGSQGEFHNTPPRVM